MIKLNSGDVVRLKSGGPVMTVGIQLSSRDHNFAKCIWFFKKTSFSSINSFGSPQASDTIWEGPHESCFPVDGLELVK